MSDQQGQTAVADPTHTDKQKGPAYTAEHPEYPKLLYNIKKRTTAVAKDKDDEQKKAADGFGLDPYPPEDPDQLTQDEVATLQQLLAKAAKALAKLGKLQAADQGNDKPATTDKATAPPPKK